MQERLKFIVAWLDKEGFVADLCRRYGISRKTGHKWIARYHSHGLTGLEELSRAPQQHPNATPADIEEAIISFRQQRPQWGPRKILDRLSKRSPDIPWPAASTFGAIIKRRGLIPPRPYKLKTPPQETPLHPGQKPNDVWAADFKGWFRTGDGLRVDTLTVTDWASRYLINCHGIHIVSLQNVRTQFERMFREFGLPIKIRTDNGAPFAGAGLGGLSRLSAWWVRLGIMPERIRPGHPEENGRHERMHRTLKAATARPPCRTFHLQQASFAHFRREYNQDRPHEALGMRTPEECYRPSERKFPSRLPDIEYGPDYERRTVRNRGGIKWAGEMLYVSEALIGETVGLRQIDNALWALYYGPMLLGAVNDRAQVVKNV